MDRNRHNVLMPSQNPSSAMAPTQPRLDLQTDLIIIRLELYKIHRHGLNFGKGQMISLLEIISSCPKSLVYNIRVQKILSEGDLNLTSLFYF